MFYVASITFLYIKSYTCTTVQKLGISKSFVFFINHVSFFQDKIYVVKNSNKYYYLK